MTCTVKLMGTTQDFGDRVKNLEGKKLISRKIVI